MFSRTVKSLYCIAEKNWSQETFWTCFAFDGIEPDDLHCTHKFLGEQSPGQLAEIKDVLEKHFRDNPHRTFTHRFSEPEMFGPNKDVRVLRLETHEIPPEFLPDLREQLDRFRDDNYLGGYKPHVTTDQDVIDRPLSRYCLCQGNKILREW